MTSLFKIKLTTYFILQLQNSRQIFLKKQKKSKNKKKNVIFAKK